MTARTSRTGRAGTEHSRFASEETRRRGEGILVAGAGHFGSRALEAMARLHPQERLVAVDQDPMLLQPWRGLGVETIAGDAVAALDRLLKDAPPQWVIPAVPFHLAHAWVLRRLARTHCAKRLPIPAGLDLPNASAAPSGDVYCSFATFTCPENCPEPPETCTVTGERRTEPLFRRLGRLMVPGILVKGLRSYQLAAGVGGYRSRDLWDLLAAVEEAKGDLILYTACRCHGVLSGLRVEPP